jgi:hypothetical protein
MYRGCGVRSNKFVLDLYNSLIADNVTERHWSKIDELKISLQNKLIFDCFSRRIIFYNKRYLLIYFSEKPSDDVISILERIARQKVETDTFSVKVVKTTAITRRKKDNKRQGEAYTIYSFHRVLLYERHFLPCCIALRISGYQLKEVYF